MDFVFAHMDEESPDLLFVEVEDEFGRGISVGEWVDREDGYKALRLPQDAEALMRSIVSWQNATFGEHQPIEGMINHLIKEVGEIKNDPDDPVEYADAFILLVGCAARKGVDLVAEATRKMEINRKRTWKVADHDGVIEHIKEEPDERPG